MIAEVDKLHVARNAAKRPAMELPFAIWMALAKATPFKSGEMAADGDYDEEFWGKVEGNSS